MEADTLVATKGVDVRFGRHQVLEGVDVSVGAGQIVTVVGPNGAGKSTLLRVVLGLLRPDHGSVMRRPGLRVGYVPQKLAVDSTLPVTVRRFLSTAVAGPVLPAALAAALEGVKAAHVLDRPLHAVSGGELRRTLLARAILRRPHLLVLDEPMGGVDVVGQAELYGMISRISRDTGCGVLMVSHELHLVMAATDRVICLNRHVCCAGHPHAVSRDPAYVAMFGPQVAASLAFYSHHHDHLHDEAGRVRPIADDAEPRHG